MTRAETLLSAAAKKLAAQQTANTFTVGASATVFTGSITQDTFDSTMEAGGRSLVGRLLIVAASDQFTAAGVVLAPGDSITYAGQRWVVENIPNANATAGMLRIECALPARR